MNLPWKNFLLSQSVELLTDAQHPFIEYQNPCLYPITDLAVLTVSGEDAGKFLQGQITANVYDVTETNSVLTAICNPKGRVISTFILVKAGQDFLLLLPSSLLAIVKQVLQKYVLRSAVMLTDNSDNVCLFGFSDTAMTSEFLATQQQESVIRIQLDQRCLVMAKPEQAIALWHGFTQQSYHVADESQWKYLDMMAKIPWLTPDSSGHFIPQMLNIDKLGGISFSKGCYTGQEIVARTHYLGKAKRAMYLADCSLTPEGNIEVLNSEGQTVGNVLCAVHNRLLIVLQQDSDTAQLRLNDYNQSPITILPIELS